MPEFDEFQTEVTIPVIEQRNDPDIKPVASVTFHRGSTKTDMVLLMCGPCSVWVRPYQLYHAARCVAPDGE